jgi:hypothetical protein
MHGSADDVKVLAGVQRHAQHKHSCHTRRKQLRRPLCVGAQGHRQQGPCQPAGEDDSVLQSENASGTVDAHSAMSELASAEEAPPPGPRPHRCNARVEDFVQVHVP